MVDDRLRRAAARYTVGLWVAGFAWLSIILWALGRLYGGIGLVFEIPYVVGTILLALCLQAVILRSRGWPTRRRHVAIALLALACSLLSGLIDTQWSHWVAQHYVPDMWAWAEGSVTSWLRASFLYSWIYCLNVAIVMLLIATHGAKEQAELLAKANQAVQTARLTMLRFQLNPHFLFNSLNAVSSLVVTRQNERAEMMIQHLAAFLRSSNSSDPSELVTLSEELATIEEYLEVEAIRFGDRIVVELSVPPSMNMVLVPSFLLQPIVENSIKYAVAPSRDTVTIRIEATEQHGRMTLVVADDGRAGPPAAGGTGVGLQNVRARLAAFFGEAATFQGGSIEAGYQVTVTMPAWRKQAAATPPPPSPRPAPAS